MIILVTGAAGFIGSHTVEHFLERGHKVVAVDNESAKSNSAFYWDDRAANYKVDICDYDAVRRLFDDVDVVIHLAAQARIQPSLIDPTETMRTNVFGTSVVLRCAKEAGVKRVVFGSSSSVYGNGELPNKEDQEPDPLNPYAQSKVMGEELCKTYHDEHGLDTVILRYFNAYGPRQPDRGPYATLFAKFEKQFKAGEPLTVVGDGNQRRDFTHVDDIVKANYLAATMKLSKEKLGREYNVGTGINYSINEIVKLFKSKKEKVEKRDSEAEETLADNLLITTKLTWLRSVYLDEYINGIVHAKRKADKAPSTNIKWKY